MTTPCDQGCDNHRIVRCAWCRGAYQLYGYKNDHTHAIHGEIYMTVKQAEQGVREKGGPVDYENWMTIKKEFYRRKREERRAAKQPEKNQ